MNQGNDKYKQFITMFLLTLFIVGCGGGGGGGDNGGDSTNEVPVAVAGDDFLVSRNFNVSLDGSGSSDADSDPLTFTWTQTAGPDVTSGTGSLIGETPSFQAPEEVSTLIFELVVNDGQQDSLADIVGINVLEDANAAFFVDGDTGSDDTGIGSVEAPFASIAGALCAVTQEQQDIYVKTLANNAVYDETIDPCPGEPARSVEKILTIPTGTSLYGGYDESGIRDAINNPTSVDTSHHGFIFTAVNFDAWFSGFDIRSGDSPVPENSVYVLSALGGSASIYIYDNQLIAGDVAFGNANSPGSSYGLRVALMETAIIERNIISAGFGGDGLDLDIVFPDRNTQGWPGSNGSGGTGGPGGGGRYPNYYSGGDGGNRSGGPDGFCAVHDGSPGADGQGTLGGAGGAAGTECGQDGSNGGSGGNGNHGAIGLGGNGSGSIDVYEDGGFFASFLPANGIRGNSGGSGHGGGGGGGGAESLYRYAGSGGGGGGGGAGGTGGPGGDGGGASIGLFVAAVNSVLIDDNEITSGVGGNGATGGLGQLGGLGGLGGNGVLTGNAAGNGGNGGTGGIGGTGGRGGAGGGGPSYGIAVGSNIAPTISNNVISSGNGGAGGFGDNGGNGGDGGNSYVVFDYDTEDGLVPVLTNNTPSFSIPGEGGGTSGTGGNSGATGGSGAINW